LTSDMQHECDLFTSDANGTVPRDVILWVELQL